MREGGCRDVGDTGCWRGSRAHLRSHPQLQGGEDADRAAVCEALETLVFSAAFPAGAADGAAQKDDAGAAAAYGRALRTLLRHLARCACRLDPTVPWAALWVVRPGEDPIAGYAAATAMAKEVLCGADSATRWARAALGAGATTTTG